MAGPRDKPPTSRSRSRSKTTNPRSGRHVLHNDADTLQTHPPRLLSNKQVPEWYAKEHILTGYRPITSSLQACLASLAYLHNDSVNIYSHLLPTAAAVILALCIPQHFWAAFPEATPADWFVLKLYISNLVASFGVSTVHHMLRCHSHRMREVMVRLEYIGVLSQIVASFATGIYTTFYCQPGLQKFYWSTIGALATVTAGVALNPFLQSITFGSLRAFSFVITGLSMIAPMIHAATMFPYEQLENQAGLRYYYVEAAVLVVAVLIYATNFPECWSPGRFDIWGASHQIFHVLMVVAVATHLCGILSAYRWNYDHPRCQSTAQSEAPGAG